MYFYCLDISCSMYSFFFFNDTATTEIYTLSLHDALPIFCQLVEKRTQSSPRFLAIFDDENSRACTRSQASSELYFAHTDRKSTRLNSSHANISYAVFCLKKKKHNKYIHNKQLQHIISHRR